MEWIDFPKLILCDLMKSPSVLAAPEIQGDDLVHPVQPPHHHIDRGLVQVGHAPDGGARLANLENPVRDVLVG